MRFLEKEGFIEVDKNDVSINKMYLFTMFTYARQKKLKGMLLQLLLLSILTAFQASVWSCKKEEQPAKVIPSVVVHEVTNITSNSVTISGQVTSDGGLPVERRGFCLSSTHVSPDLRDFVAFSGEGSGNFTTTITGLAPGTVYFLSAFATNSAGTAFQKYSSFKTLSIVPEVSTNINEPATHTSFDVWVNISYDGGAFVEAKGVCWSTKENPTIEDNKTSDGKGSESFKTSVTGLTPGTTYYVRSYATNLSGTGYGNQIIINTKSALPKVYTYLISYSSITARIVGTIENNSTDIITSRGICWSDKPGPTIQDNKTEEDGNGWNSAIEGLTPNTTYYARAYITNGLEIGYGEELTFTTESMQRSFEDCYVWANYTSDNFYLIDRINQLFKSTDNGKTWTFVSKLSFYNTLPLKIIGNILYGSDQGKIYKSEDQGKNWSTISRWNDSDGIKCFDIDPITNDIYAISNTALLRYDGISWTKIKTTTSDNPSQWVSIDHQGTIYYDLYESEIYKSTDKGVTWNKLNYNYNQIPNFNDKLYLTEDNILLMNKLYYGIYQLDGNDFVPLNTGIEVSGQKRGIKQMVTRGNNYYTLTTNNGDNSGLFVSNNKGLQWNMCNYNLTTDDLIYFRNMAINRAGEVIISISSTGCYKLDRQQNQWELLK